MKLRRTSFLLVCSLLAATFLTCLGCGTDKPHGHPRPEPEVSDVEAEQLQKVLTRFDKVSSNSQYSQIAQLPAFRATHEILAVYMSHFIAPPAAPGIPE